MQFNKQFNKTARSIMLVGMMSTAIGLTACQKQEAETVVDDTTVTEQEVPMSAEPAEPSNAVVVTEEQVTTDDPNAMQVADDTVAQVDTPVTQVTYVCTPELKFDASYNTTAKTVTINTPQGSVELDTVGDGAYEVATALDGSAGLTQWRTAAAQNDSGVLRVSTGADDAVTAYECSAASS